MRPKSSKATFYKNECKIEESKFLLWIIKIQYLDNHMKPKDEKKCRFLNLKGQFSLLCLLVGVNETVLAQLRFDLEVKKYRSN